MRLALLLALVLPACTADDVEPAPDAAPVEPDAALIACEDCGGGVCQPSDGWRCANAETVFVPCDNAPAVCE